METDTMRRRTRYSNASRWIRAKYHGRCHCGKEINPGDRAMYYPTGKRIACTRCGRETEFRITEEDLNAILKIR